MSKTFGFNPLKKFKFSPSLILGLKCNKSLLNTPNSKHFASTETDLAVTLTTN